MFSPIVLSTFVSLVVDVHFTLALQMTHRVRVSRERKKERDTESSFSRFLVRSSPVECPNATFIFICYFVNFFPSHSFSCLFFSHLSNSTSTSILSFHPHLIFFLLALSFCNVLQLTQVQMSQLIV